MAYVRDEEFEWRYTVLEWRMLTTDRIKSFKEITRKYGNQHFRQVLATGSVKDSTGNHVKKGDVWVLEAPFGEGRVGQIYAVLNVKVTDPQSPQTAWVTLSPVDRTGREMEHVPLLRVIAKQLGTLVLRYGGTMDPESLTRSPNPRPVIPPTGKDVPVLTLEQHLQQNPKRDKTFVEKSRTTLKRLIREHDFPVSAIMTPGFAMTADRVLDGNDDDQEYLDLLLESVLHARQQNCRFIFFTGEGNSGRREYWAFSLLSGEYRPETDLDTWTQFKELWPDFFHTIPLDSFREAYGQFDKKFRNAIVHTRPF